MDQEYKYDLSIVVPCYKEEKRLDLIAKAIESYSGKSDLSIETIIVVDGSPDQTAEVAKGLAQRIRNLKVIDRKVNKGKGFSVKEGVLAAAGKYILFADADNSTPLRQVDVLLRDIDKNEVVIGSRYKNGGRLAKPQSITRRIGSRILNIIIQILAVWGVKDTQCGFKLFQARAARAIFKRATFERFSFDIEILAIARKLGYKIEEAGIVWYDNPHSTVKPLKDGVQMIKDAWKVRKNIISGKYKLSHKLS